MVSLNAKGVKQKSSCKCEGHHVEASDTILFLVYGISFCNASEPAFALALLMSQKYTQVHNPSVHAECNQ